MPEPKRFDQFSGLDLIVALVGLLGAAVAVLRWLAMHGDNALDVPTDPALD